MLHLITLFVIIILYQKLKVHKNIHVDEFKEMFQTYLDEFKQENLRLERQLRNNDSVLNDTSQQQEPTAETNVDFKENTVDDVETSLTANILSMADQGYSPDEIAQRLKCGKTEAELVIKFYQENNRKA